MKLFRQTERRPCVIEFLLWRNYYSHDKNNAPFKSILIVPKSRTRFVIQIDLHDQLAPAVGHVNILKHIMEIYWILILTLLCINVDKIDASDERNYFTRVSSSSLMQEILDPLSIVEHKHDNGIRLISSQLSPISMIK